MTWISFLKLGYYFYLRGSKDFGHAFLIISAALFPLGIGTTLDIIGISAMGLGGINIDIAILLIIYFISYYSLRASVFLPLTILAASALFFTFTNYLFGGNLPLQHFDQYRIAILGLSWLSFAYYFSQREMKFMTNVMYLFGLSMLLGSTASLQGHFPNASFFWENAFPVLIVLTFYASTKLQNRVFLVLAILFTIGEILYLTAEYSSSGLGWPLYRIAILGLSWLSFAYYFSKREMRFIPNVMYFFGLLMLLGSTASLQGYYPNASIFWELAFPFLIIAVFYGSIRIQSKIFLVLATLFTIGEILKLTAEYFSEGLGWPISLIVAGLIIMGVSYISFELNRRFLKPSSSISSVPSQT